MNSTNSGIEGPHPHTPSQLRQGRARPGRDGFKPVYTTVPGARYAAGVENWIGETGLVQSSQVDSARGLSLVPRFIKHR